MITSWKKTIRYIGAVRPLVYAWPTGSGAIPPPAATQRGNIAFDQIAITSRTGNGNQLLTWTFFPPPRNNSTGTPNQIAYDAVGNFYWCYATNQWARIGPGGYSNTF